MSLVTKATAAANKTYSKQTEQDEADTYTGGSVGRGQCHTHTQRTAILQLTCDMEIIRHADSNTCIEISAAAQPSTAPPTWYPTAPPIPAPHQLPLPPLPHPLTVHPSSPANTSPPTTRLSTRKTCSLNSLARASVRLPSSQA